MAIEILSARTPSFSDRRVVLVCAGDTSTGCASFWPVETAVASEQDEDGPTHLIIGALADDAALARAAKRYNLRVEDLVSFRDAQRIGQGLQHG